MKRADGHKLGYASLFGSVVCFGVAANNRDWLFAGGGLVLVGCGSWLLTRLYMNDPEAVKEYAAKARAMPLSEILVNRVYNWNQLTQLLSEEEIREKFEAECPIKDNDIVSTVRRYTQPWITHMVKHGIITKGSMSARCDKTLTRAKSFSWLHKDLGHGLWELTDYGLSIDRIRQKFFDEYNWVSDSGKLVANLPPEPEDAPPGQPYGVMRAVATYGLDCCSKLSVSVNFFQTVIATCPENSKANFTTLIEQDIFKLHGMGFVDVNWSNGVFWRQVIGHDLPLFVAEDRLQLTRSLESGVVTFNEHLCVMFREAIPMKHSNSTSRQDNIVIFVEYWQKVIRRYPGVIPEKSEQHILYAAQLGQTVDKNYQRDIDSAKRRFNERIAVIDEAVRVRKMANREATETPAQKKERDAAKKAYDEEIRQAERDRQEGKVNIHSHFVSGFQNRQAVSDLAGDVKSCLQQ